MSCGDLCTAAKCASLEARIDRLEELINELTVRLTDHTNMPVPYSHDYLPNFDVDTTISGNELTTKVRIENREDSRTITLPDSVVPTVAIEVIPIDNYNHTIVVTVNESVAEATLTTHQPQIQFGIEELDGQQYSFGILLDDVAVEAILDLNSFEPSSTDTAELDFDVNVSYLFNLLNVAMTINGVTKSDTVYIDADVINRFGGGGGGINIGGDDVGCQQIADSLQLELGEILAAIAAVQAQVTQVKEIVTVEVEGIALTKFDCPKPDPDSGKETNAAQVEDYKLAILPALHEQLKFMNQNQLAMFERICEGGGAIALPAWWQTRLNADVSQIACVFRKGGSSTYHSLSIPHPANTDKPTKALLPAYTKGNYQGMVICRDNSKFIINCVSEAEAERMCQIAIELIDSEWLESPPRTYFGKRKGQAVSVDPMLPTSVEYFESGQQNTIPNWRVRISEFK